MTEMTQKMENEEKTVFANETTAAETPYVVMGELLLRAVERAGTIIAVNQDRYARIFDFADFGILEYIDNVEL